mmetsp:Transcript_25203/g.74019  ORF Transcript_25203/g.74019 Transcript_25203/m.74019 type:complete len:523 (-) Transcript_25203:618-2186(-)
MSRTVRSPSAPSHSLSKPSVLLGLSEVEVSSPSEYVQESLGYRRGHAVRTDPSLHVRHVARQTRICLPSELSRKSRRERLGGDTHRIEEGRTHHLRLQRRSSEIGVGRVGPRHRLLGTIVPVQQSTEQSSSKILVHLRSVDEYLLYHTGNFLLELIEVGDARSAATGGRGTQRRRSASPASNSPLDGNVVTIQIVPKQCRAVRPQGRIRSPQRDESTVDVDTAALRRIHEHDVMGRHSPRRQPHPPGIVMRLRIEETIIVGEEAMGCGPGGEGSVLIVRLLTCEIISDEIGIVTLDEVQSDAGNSTSRSVVIGVGPGILARSGSSGRSSLVLGILAADPHGISRGDAHGGTAEDSSHGAHGRSSAGDGRSVHAVRRAAAGSSQGSGGASRRSAAGVGRASPPLSASGSAPAPRGVIDPLRRRLPSARSRQIRRPTVRVGIPRHAAQYLQSIPQFRPLDIGHGRTQGRSIQQSTQSAALVQFFRMCSRVLRIGLSHYETRVGRGGGGTGTHGCHGGDFAAVGQ